MDENNTWIKAETDEYYKQLVEEFSDTVTRLCVVHTGNYADAEDCYQNVFFKLYKTLKKEDIPNPKAWLIRVALNECNSLLRFRLRTSTEALDKITQSAQDSREHEMLDIISRQPPKYRDVIYLYYYEDMTIDEIAAAIGTNANTVKTRLKRAKEKLKKYITEQERVSGNESFQIV